ncbi:MAG: hypothetical protein ACI9GK_003092, partial [Devosia sp.]
MPASESTLTTGQHIWEHALHRARLGVWDWN